jgi:PAS domain S-box-containing protein
MGTSIWLDGIHRYVPDAIAPNATLDEKTLIIEADSPAMVSWHGSDAWNRTAPDELSWSHRIDQGPWSPYRQESRLVLRELSSGKHSVEVRSRDADFNESNVSDVLSISVLPPFWIRPWFVGTAGLLLAMLLWQSISLIRRGIAIRVSNEQLEQARSQLAEKFAEKSAQFRAVCDCSPIGIFVTDTSGQVTYFNQCLERIAGRSSQAAQNEGWTDAVHPDDRDRVVQAWNQSVEEKVQYECSARFLHDDGKITWFDVVADRIEVNGELLGYVGAVEDISERIHASNELQQSNSKLHQALDQLKHAQDQAIKRERLSALGQMAAGVAHDINNSLAPLLSYSELLADNDEIQGTSRRFVELIRLGVSDTAGIVKRLDHFYRDSHNREFLDSFRLAELVAQSIELTRPNWQDAALAEGKAIEVRVESTSNALVDGQSSQMRAVMTNLIFNAVDAISGRGTVTIHVGETSSHAFVVVADDGSGMTSEQLDRCLEPFYTTKEKGSGLGLSECHGVVRQHGGEIEIESEPGYGTQVRILLPISSRNSGHAEDQNAKDASVGVADVQIIADVKPHTAATDVLYIDDDAMVRQSTVALLKAIGMTVETVSDGPTGLKSLEESEFRLVLCDQGLPGMDGIAVLCEIKQRWPDLPVVIVSGWSLRDLGDGVQPDDFLEKPVGYEDLRGMLQRHLGSINAA